MGRQLSKGERVQILAGDERGGWGTVVSYLGENSYEIAVYGSTTDVRLFERSELRKPRKQGG